MGIFTAITMETNDLAGIYIYIYIYIYNKYGFMDSERPINEGYGQYGWMRETGIFDDLPPEERKKREREREIEIERKKEREREREREREKERERKERER
jgi:hypothetical protein